MSLSNQVKDFDDPLFAIGKKRELYTILTKNVTPLG